MDDTAAKEIIRLLSKLLAETKALRDDLARRANEPASPYARRA